MCSCPFSYGRQSSCSSRSSHPENASALSQTRGTSSQDMEKTAYDLTHGSNLVERIIEQGERYSDILKNMKKARGERSLVKK